MTWVERKGILDREMDKFVDSPGRQGKTSIEVVIANANEISAGGADSASLTSYQTNYLEDSEPIFIGKTNATGKWLIERFSEAAGTKLYANASNNPTYSDLDTAWINRATLIFNQFHILTGV